MSTPYRCVVIGTGRGGENRGGAHSIGYAHGNNYTMSPRTELVAAADLVPEHVQRFTDNYELPADAAYVDYRKMLDELKPDIVSIATYVGTHAEMLDASIDAGAKGIFCEKPFCQSMDEGRQMVAACDAAGVKLVVNHYRRTLDAFIQARDLVQGGAIGQSVLFLSGIDGWDLMEWGTHWLDMYRFLAGDQPVDWVMGQGEITGKKTGYGHVMEEHALAYFKFADGTRGVLEGGEAPHGEAAIRLIGTEGILEIMNSGTLVLTNAKGRQEIKTSSTIHGPLAESNDPKLKGNQTETLLDSFLNWMEGGPESGCSGRNALASSELYLAAYESALSSGKIQIPMEAQADFPPNRRAA